MKEEQRKIIIDYINGVFMWSYKKGDNIIYNFDILWALYKAKKHYPEAEMLYNKPITITIVSIIECVLDDFINRIQQHTADPLPNITTSIVKDFKYKGEGQSLAIKKLSKFTHYIDMSKKHKIFGDNENIYVALHFLRDVRNKVHIQISREDENMTFDEKSLKLSEEVLEHIIKTMVEKYPRNKICQTKLINFPFPWNIV